MSRYRGPRVRAMRALGVQLPGLSSKSHERRPYPPGQHGQARRKVSEYGLRLLEKQKLSRNYGVSERQLRGLVVKARSADGPTGERLLELLERRLDNVVFRAGFARTIPAARQLVNHGQILVDGRRVDISSYRVRPGEVLTVTPHMLENGHVKSALEDTSLPIPEWIERTTRPVRALVRALPDATSILFELRAQLVIEFYSMRL